MTNNELKQAAIEAIKAFHADTSVGIETTLDGLNDIISEAEMLADACENDLHI